MTADDAPDRPDDDAAPDVITVTCPSCDGELRVDVRTGHVLQCIEPDKPIAGGKDFDSLFAEIDRGKARAEDVFTREMGALEDRDRLMEAKFAENLKRAKADPDKGPPERPWDFD
ncbi:MAG: hypothetical protein AAF772_08040 [Acidobacteriota bacterium]